MNETTTTRLDRLEKLASLGRTMRQLQRRWFAGDKSSETLRHSKDAERRFDAALAELDDDQPRLF